MTSFESIFDENIFDNLYVEYCSDPYLFVLEVCKYIHNCVDKKLTSIDECKRIVYEYDVVQVLDIWEGQAECSRGEFAEKPTYLDFVFVPIFEKVFSTLETKYEIEFKKNQHTGYISINDTEIPWHCIYFRNCFN